MGINIIKTLAFTLIVDLYTHLHVRGENTTYSFNPTYTISQCGVDVWTFRSYFNVSLSTCMTECGRRPKCLALNYRRHYSHLCQLLEDTSSVTELPENCLYLRREHIDFTDVLVNGCGCAVGETCDLEDNTCSKTECAAVRNVENGRINGNRYEIGNGLIVVCDQGYEPTNGVTKVTCLTTGDWDNVLSCQKMCDPPAILTNGVISGTNYSLGSSLNVTCDPNYREMNLLTEITCLSSAVWNEQPICVLKECPSPTSFANGAYTGSDFTIGSTLIITCSPNYREQSDFTHVTCLSTLVWDNIPVCILEECPSPTSLTNGAYTGSDFTIGSTLTVTCNTNYREQSDLTHVTCLSTLMWDNIPVCVPEECSAPPTLSHGTISTASVYTVGTILSVTCNPGYTEKCGLSTITCLHTLNWNKTPTCDPIDCGSPPSLQYGSLSGSGNHFQDTRTVNCNNGYTEINNIAEIVCLSTGNWDYQPECVISATCPSNWVQFESSCFYVSTSSEGKKSFESSKTGQNTERQKALGIIATDWNGTGNVTEQDRNNCLSYNVQCCNSVVRSQNVFLRHSVFQTYCIGLGGNLVRLDSSGKYDTVRSTLISMSNTNANYWIGLRKASNTNNNAGLKWVDNNEPYSYERFASGQPEPGDNELCIFLWEDDIWQWHDGMCNWSNRFVCEKPAS